MHYMLILSESLDAKNFEASLMAAIIKMPPRNRGLVMYGDAVKDIRSPDRRDELLNKIKHLTTGALHALQMFQRETESTYQFPLDRLVSSAIVDELAFRERSLCHGNTRRDAASAG